MTERSVILEKLRESAVSVLPITGIVFVLCLFLVPVGTDLLLSFLIAAAMLLVGMGLFNLGVEQSMSLIGSYTGARMTRSKRLWLILSLSFLLGLAITIAEPDLQVLAGNVPNIPRWLLIFAVSAGVGFFLLLCMVRILFAIPLRWMLLGFYALLFLLAAFSDPDFLSIAFDSGGVTTGPMTVPFIMALGVGVASIRSDENAKSDSFGLVALCSIGPILAVLLLGFLIPDSAGDIAAEGVQRYSHSRELGWDYIRSLPDYIKEVSLALSPIVVFFLIFQAASLKLEKKPFLRILLGLALTWGGLVLFLAGVNIGFSPLGRILGQEIASGRFGFLLVPLAMLMGWFIINAEPAVHVLNRQVEELSAGAISAGAMGLSLSIAIAAAMGLAMVRVLTGISILWFLIPGYVAALVLSFVVPPTFTAIAFDSGGVASGPLTATFMLPFAMGACTAVGGNIATDAFGLVALVAMMPLITVQIMGAISVAKGRRGQQAVVLPTFADDEIIELWEVEPLWN